MAKRLLSFWQKAGMAGVGNMAIAGTTVDGFFRVPPLFRAGDSGGVGLGSRAGEAQNPADWRLSFALSWPLPKRKEIWRAKPSDGSKLAIA